MDYGVHLPLIQMDDAAFSVARLAAYAARAERLGFRALAANDHLLFPRPWLDGPTALAVALPSAPRAALMTTVALPVVRGPVALAKTLAALDLLSGGRLIAGLGPGSSAADYAAAGVPFAQRWPRFEEAVRAVRALWRGEGSPFTGAFYSTAGIALRPAPAQPSGPPIWLGSWGSDTGLRRTARLADGWLASAYNTTPATFAEARERLRGHLRRAGKVADRFPTALATMFLYVTEDRAAAAGVVEAILCPMLNRPAAVLHERLAVGPAEVCAARLRAYRAAGAGRVLLWPVADELRQLDLFWERVVPLVGEAVP
jgi:alkanesulfonate monooxygenase SsuD/methylene tetrahydromethanopterin reductase-like flavin-dependent oxidoreductase (luciferase family)